MTRTSSACSGGAGPSRTRARRKDRTVATNRPASVTRHIEEDLQGLRRLLRAYHGYLDVFHRVMLPVSRGKNRPVDKCRRRDQAFVKLQAVALSAAFV